MENFLSQRIRQAGSFETSLITSKHIAELGDFVETACVNKPLETRHWQCDLKAFTVETKVSSRTDEERLEEVRLCQLVDVPRDVDVTPGDGNGATKAEKPIEVEGGDLGVVTLEVGEVEVIGERLLKKKTLGSNTVRPNFLFCNW